MFKKQAIPQEVKEIQQPQTAMEEKKRKDRFDLVEVPTETGILIRDNETESMMDIKEALVNILNIVNEIKKSVA